MRGGMVPLPVVLVLVLGLAVLIAGCIDDRGPASIDTEGMYTLTISTSYDEATRDRSPPARDPESLQTRLPHGFPAGDLLLSVWFPQQETSGATWEHDPPCPERVEAGHHRAECGEEEYPRKSAYVLPPPSRYAEDGIWYPLDAEGRIVFRFPESFRGSFDFLGRRDTDGYTEMMRQAMEDPEACPGDAVASGSFRVARVEGDVEVDRGGMGEFTGNASVLLRYFGLCSRAVQ